MTFLLCFTFASHVCHLSGHVWLKSCHARSVVYFSTQKKTKSCIPNSWKRSGHCSEKHWIQIISVDSPIGMNESRSSNDRMLWMLNNRVTTPVFATAIANSWARGRQRSRSHPLPLSHKQTETIIASDLIIKWKGSWSNKNEIAYSVMTGGNFPPYHSWFSNWDEWEALNPNHPCWFADLRMIVCYKW